AAILAIAIAAVCIALPIATFSASAVEQSVPGSLLGAVSDTSGAAVRAATVIVSALDGRTEVTTTTNANGRFAFANLPAGPHVIQVFATGFGPSRIINIDVKAGRQSIQDIKMDIGLVANQDSKTAVAVSPSIRVAVGA